MTKETTFEHVFEDHAQFAAKTFPLSTANSSLKHLKKEIKEVKEMLWKDDMLNKEACEHFPDLIEEYADMVLCIVSGATKAGIAATQLVEAMHKKVQINKVRKWKYNGDGTYSHIKE